MKVTLPERETVTLSLHGDLSLSEIADVQNISITTAKTRYRYGLEKLIRILDKQVQK